MTFDWAAVPQAAKVKFWLKVNSLVMLSCRNLFSQGTILKASLVWAILLWHKKVSLQFLTKWWSRNCWRITCSHSPLQILKRGLISLLATMTKRSSRVILRGTMYCSNTCTGLNSMISKSTANPQVCVANAKSALSQWTQELPLWLFHRLLRVF